MTNTIIIETTTYEEVPQIGKISRSIIPNDKPYYILLGLGFDFLAFQLLHLGFLPIASVLLLSVKCTIDESLYRQLLLSVSIRETKERTEPAQPEQLKVNTSYDSRLIPSVSDDRHINDFVLSGKDYDALSAYYASSDDNGFRRDDSISGRGVSSLCDSVTTSNFGNFGQNLRVVGYLDSKNEWTELGVRWLNGNVN